VSPTIARASATRQLGIAGLLVGLGAATGVAFGLPSCGVDVDLSGKTCPCPSGLVCDPTANRCVTTLPLASNTDGADAGPPLPACNDTSCPCAVDGDCKDPTRRFCGPEKVCVECLAAPSDTCTAGGYCNPAHQCAVGCKGEADCQSGQHCDVASHRCVTCTKDAECADAGPSKKCSQSGSCVDVCNGDGTACGSGGTCCGGLCLSLATDVLNCGHCGTACSTSNGSPSCAAGKCSWKCVEGYDHCGPPQDNTGCETSVRTTDNCGACGAACTAAQVRFANGIACAGTACTYATCQQGHADFDKNPANGCEAPCGGNNQTCCPTGLACNNGNCRPNGKCSTN
jgi:hypothetical protein